MRGRAAGSRPGSLGGYLALCADVLVACMASMLFLSPPVSGQDESDVSRQQAAETGAEAASPSAEDVEKAQSLLEAQHKLQNTAEEDVPAAFAAEREANPDVCAWLYVPGTNVSLPVAWRAGDNGYYTVHDSSGDVSGLGSCFMDGANSVGFDDPVTVLYGHSFCDDDLMFTQLHKFEDEGFFGGHDEFEVHLPDRVLTYRVAATGLYLSRRITDVVDFSNREQVQEYLDFAVNPRPSDGLKREVGRLDAGSDRIVQLSTCTLPEANESARYLVTGVLVGEEGMAG